MNKKILVAYASRAGSTAGVAEAIGKTLIESGAQVDIIPVSEVMDLAPYQAVVVGSAIRKSKWLPEAMQFVQTHRAELKQKPFATFTVCITLAMSGSAPYHQAVTEWIRPVREQVQPVSEGLFAGQLDFGKLPVTFDTLLLRAMVAFGVFPKGDCRDWNAIRAWTESLRPMFRQ